MKSRISLLITAIALLYVTFNYSNWRNKNMLIYDSSYYYLYLPATIIYQDLGKLSFYPELIRKYDINFQQPTYELYPQKTTGNILNKYAVGVSICELPLFLVAHLYCIVTHEYAADGYTLPYRCSVVFSILLWVLAGLFVLRKFLLRFFDDASTAITLALIMFGTNLYMYTCLDIGMSHPFSFSFFCFLLYCTERAYSTAQSKYIVWIGAILGMIAIIRPTNLLVALLPLCWPYKNENPASNKVHFLRNKIGAIAVSAIVFTSITFIQLAYLKYTSGNWFHFSYEEEWFNFLKPEIINGLFSYRKGWFVYTPVAFIAVIGFIPLWQRHKQISVLISIYLVVAIYVIFSWCLWAYGGSFGCRPLIESLAVMSIPLAAFIQDIFTRKGTALKIAASTVFVFFITLNIFQSYQMINNITMWDNTNKAFYWRSFGKLNVTDEDRALLKEQ